MERLTKVVDKEFSAELAGERVGWISVQDAPVDPGIKMVNVATATVGESGASLEHYELDGEASYVDNDNGFEAATGVYVPIIVAEGTVAMNGIQRHIATETGQGASLIRNNRMGRIDPNEKTWVVGSAELIDTIKTKLREHDLEKYYPYIYYNLNIINALREANNGLAPAVKNILLPDATMQETTRTQIELARVVRRAMKEISTEDQRMARRLTVFSDIPAAKVPGVFVESRQRVAALEGQMRASTLNMFAASAVYVPTGQGKGGRTWPYMDATESDPEKSYGLELAALEDGSVERVTHELRRETAEAKAREEHVERAIMLLQRLQKREG